MRLSVPRSKGSGIDDGVMPMINIVFLLLVFFMVAGTVRPANPVDTRPPFSERDGSMPSAPQVLHLGADGSLALDGRTLTLGELSTSVGAPVVAPSSALIDGRGIAPGDASAGALALHADAKVPFAVLRDTIDALRAAGLRQVELITDPVASLDP